MKLRLLIVLAVIVAGAAVAAGVASMGKAPAAQEVLAPAPGPPVGGLCSATVSYSNGNASPLFCANGDINRVAWNYYARRQLSVMGLGIFAADTDVAAALRQDLSGGATSAVECSAYQLATAYYGWKFGFDPALGVLAPVCPIRIN